MTICAYGNYRKYCKERELKISFTFENYDALESCIHITHGSILCIAGRLAEHLKYVKLNQSWAAMCTH